MKKMISAHLIWAIAGLVVTIGGFVIAGGTFNWDDCAEIKFSFSKDDSEEYSSYYSLNGTSELTSYQTVGNSKCEYDLYKRTRTNSSYKKIYEGETYDSNDEMSNIYDVSFGSWADTKFLMKKVAGTTVKSVVMVAIEN